MSESSLRKPETFTSRARAGKAQEVLRYIHSVKTTLQERTEESRTVYDLIFDPLQEEKVAELEREINTVCLIVRCFEVGGTVPTMECLEGKHFPTEMINPE